MDLTLKRLNLTPNYTEGELYVNNVYFCKTLEDANRDLNKNGQFDNSEKKVNDATQPIIDKGIENCTPEEIKTYVDAVEEYNNNLKEAESSITSDKTTEIDTSGNDTSKNSVNKEIEKKEISNTQETNISNELSEHKETNNESVESE